MTEIAPALRARILADPWAAALGVEFLRLGIGTCALRLTLQPHMLNFQGFPHGGVIFSLADIAFSAACNSHGPTAVALSVTIEYLEPTPPGATLVAEARQVRQGRRAGFYEIAVRAADGPIVARAHCVAHRVGDGAVPAGP